MKAVILAAGLGTRLEPLTLTLSKPMIPVANRPMIDWTIKSLEGLVDEIFIIIRKDQKDIIDHFKSGKLLNKQELSHSANKATIQLIYQDKPQGTAHAIAQAEKYIKEKMARSQNTKLAASSQNTFLVLNGDVFTTTNEMKKFCKDATPYTIASYPIKSPRDFGVFEVKGKKILKIIEKSPRPPSNLVNAGIYLFDDSIFDYIRKTKLSERNELEITDSIMIAMKDQDVYHHELKKWFHLSFPWNILEINSSVLEEYGSQIDPSATIRPGAFVEEPVAIGAGAVIGPNCFIRKHSAIGPGCKVGNAVEIKNSVIMDNSFVSHLSYVGDSIVGRNCNVAAGTIFANLRLDENNVRMIINGKAVDSGRKKLGTFVGDNVRFGVNCTIMPGKRIWPNMIIPPCSIVQSDIEKQPDIKAWKRVLA